MIKARALLVLPLAVAIGACGDTDVLPTSPEGVEQPSAGFLSGSVSSAQGLQRALDRAAGSYSPSRITIRRGAVIHLDETLTYDGAGALSIQANGATLVGPAKGNALDFYGGGDITIRGLTVTGAAEHGIYAEVPGDRTGTFHFSMTGVELRENGFAGLWIDDQVHNSAAGVSLRVVGSTVVGNNTAGVGEVLTYDQVLALADKDGIRVNEGGAGDLHSTIRNSEFYWNQADGVELDETGDGDVYSYIYSSRFDDNGDQLQFPDEAPAGFPDDPDDYEKDLEDGFDIDENDEGSIYAWFSNVTAFSNEDEGIDLDETFNGSIHMAGARIVANENFGAGIQLTESEEQEGTDGDIVLGLLNVTTNGSRDSRGIRLEEFYGGDIRGLLTRYTADGNDSDGMRVEEYDDGEIDLRIWRGAFTNNGGDGLQLEENGAVTLINALFDNNDDDDINADDDVVVTTYGGRMN